MVRVRAREADSGFWFGASRPFGRWSEFSPHPHGRPVHPECVPPVRARRNECSACAVRPECLPGPCVPEVHAARPNHSSIEAGTNFGRNGP